MLPRCCAAAVLGLGVMRTALGWVPPTTFATRRAGSVRMMVWGSGSGAKPKQSLPPAPEPKLFYVRPDRLFDIVSASAVTLLRGGNGAFVLGYGVKLVDPNQVEAGKYTFPIQVGGKSSVEKSASFVRRPKKPLIIYEFQGCPFCALVRDAVTILDLDVLFLPCPQGSVKWRPEAISKGGKSQFPYLVDPNNNVAMYESRDIVQYLFDTYGDGTGKLPTTLNLGAGTALAIGLALVPRIGRGSRATPSNIPAKPIEFWGYEASPFSRVVREVLCELELPFVQRTCARGSAKRDEMIKKLGRFQVPYIEDPNTGVKMFESAEIIEYLRKQYTADASQRSAQKGAATTSTRAVARK